MFEINKFVYKDLSIELSLIGRLDRNAKQDFQKEIQKSQCMRPQKIYINLVEVSSIDCVGVGMLASAHTSSRQLQIAIVLIVTKGHVLQTLEIAGIKRILPVIYGDHHNNFPLNLL